MPSTVYFLDLRKSHKDNYLARWDRLIKATACLDLVPKKSPVAVKLHFGEDGNVNYLNPLFARRMVESIRDQGGNPFLTDTTTLYGGRRFRADTHLELARDHGFDFAPVIIADGLFGDEFYEVNGSKFGHAYRSVEVFYFLSHFKGHMVTSFGGALKNIGMGCGSKGGKLDMHAHSRPHVEEAQCNFCLRCLDHCAFQAIEKLEKKVRILNAKCAGCGGCMAVCPERAIRNTWASSPADVCRRMAKYAADFYPTKKAFCFNFLIRISPECDCFHTNEPLIAPDIGILASSNPVALDQASLDLVREPIARAHPELNPDEQLAAAERHGAGERKYEIKII
jgi:uncharacterized Fe-S center protein